MKVFKSQHGHAHLLLFLALVAGAIGAVGYQVYNSSAGKKLSSASVIQDASGAKAETDYPCPSGTAKSISGICQKIIYPNANDPKPNEGGDTNRVDHKPGEGSAKPISQAAAKKAAAKRAAAAKAAAKRQAKADKAAAKARNIDAGGGAAASTPVSGPADTNPSPEVAETASYTSLPAVPTEKPEVNIVVFTYVKEEGHDKQRLGNVKIKIERNGGSEKCDNKKRTSGKTNGVSKTKDGRLVKGTIHFLGCTAGDYTVTALGRSGYKVVSDSTRSLSLPQERTAKVHFTLEKIVKAKKPAKTTPSTSSTGGASAP